MLFCGTVISFSSSSRTVLACRILSLDDGYTKICILGKAGYEDGTDGDCRIAEEINTFTIHLGIFTLDNLLTKLRKLAGTPLLSLQDSLIFRFPFFFSIYVSQGICGAPNKRICDFVRDFAEIHV